MEAVAGLGLAGFFGILLLTNIVTSVFSGNVAGAKGYNYFLWFMGGMLFGVIALIAAAGMPDKKLVKLLNEKGQN